jgi:periplasmic protein CpxP/Spy
MTHTTRRIVALVAAAVVASSSTLALARGGDCGHGMGEGQQGHAMQGKMAERMKDRMAKHQAELKAKLKLTAEQEGAWTQFTAAMQPPAAMQHPDRAEMAKLTTPQRLEKMQAFKAQRDAEMGKRFDATKAFYAALTPEQQKVFDAEHSRMGHGGKHGGPGGHGMPGMGRQG